MQMHSIINVENLKLYKPPMIVNELEVVQVPTIDDFVPEYLDEVYQDVIFDRRNRISCQGDVEYFQVGLKGAHPIKVKWIEGRRLRELYPQLFAD